LLERFGDSGAVMWRRSQRRIDESGSSIHQAFERVGARRHLAELVPDRAEAGNRHSELSPLCGVLRGRADRRTTSAAAHRAQAEAAVIERVQRDLVALANLAEHIASRHTHLLQQDWCRGRAVQAHLVFFLARAETWKRAFNDERREMLAVNLREDDEEIGKATVADPHLLAAQRP